MVTTTRKNWSALMLVALIFGFGQSVIAQNLQKVKLSVQGILKNFDGTIVSNNYYPVTFKIYDVATGGTAIWSESQTIQTNGGVYNTMLGTSVAGLNALQGLSYSTTYYLGVTVDGSQEMNPRMELSGSAFAIRAYLADEAKHALDADHADLADEATHATNADNATNATNASYATNAGVATVALSIQNGGGQAFGGDVSINGALTLKNDVWHKSFEGAERIYFGTNSSTFFASKDGYNFRNAAGNLDLVSIVNNGELQVRGAGSGLSIDDRASGAANRWTTYVSGGNLNFYTAGGNKGTLTSNGDFYGRGYYINSSNYTSQINQNGNTLQLNGLGDIGIYGDIVLQTNSVTRVRVNNHSNINNSGFAAMDVFGDLYVDGKIWHKNDMWHTSIDNKKRFFFANNGTSYFGSPSGYVFRNSLDNLDLLSVDNTGNAFLYGTMVSSAARINGPIYLLGGSDVNHGLQYDGNVINGPRMYGWNGVSLGATSSGSYMQLVKISNNDVNEFVVYGDICYTGGISQCSDMRYKTNIKSLSGSLNKVLKVQGVTYNWKVKDFPEKNFNENLQIGFIAQEIEKVYPELVVTDNDGYKSVDYAKLTPILVEAIKELNQKIEEQKAEIKGLKADNSSLKSTNGQLQSATESLESRLQKIEAMLNATGRK